MALSQLVALTPVSVAGTKYSQNFWSYFRFLQAHLQKLGKITLLVAAGLCAEWCSLGIINILLVGAESGSRCQKDCGNKVRYLAVVLGAICLSIYPEHILMFVSCRSHWSWTVKKSQLFPVQRRKLHIGKSFPWSTNKGTVVDLQAGPLFDLFLCKAIPTWLFEILERLSAFPTLNPALKFPALWELSVSCTVLCAMNSRLSSERVWTRAEPFCDHVRLCIIKVLP